MTTFLIVRHGETDWNSNGRIQGHADPGLNDAGREQARAIAEVLASEPVEAIHSSDLARARETAEIIGARLALPVRTHAALREIDVGEWQGLTEAEIEDRFPGALDRWRAGERGWQRGEGYDELTERVVGALREIAEQHSNGRVVVVGHGGTIRALRAHIEGVSVAESRRTTPPIGYCEVFRLRAEEDRPAGLD